MKIRSVAFLFYIAVVITILLAVGVVFILGGHKTDLSEKARREARAISVIIFEIYFLDSDFKKNLNGDAHLNSVIFNKIRSMDKFDAVEYIIGPSRKSEWIQRELLIDPWGHPYVVRVNCLEAAGSLKITIHSKGKDETFNTVNDIYFHITY